MLKNLFLVLLVFLVMLPVVVEGVPPYLSHQGRLMTSDYEPLSGVAEVTFSLYEQEETMTYLWRETLQIAFDDGFYSISLGRGEGFPDDCFDGRSLYLGITVEDSPEMMPRHHIESVKPEAEPTAVEELPQSI